MDIYKNCQFNIRKLVWGTLVSIATALAIASPSMAQNDLSRNFRPDPKVLEGEAEGNVSIASLAGIADNCRGFAKANANHTIILNTNFPLLDFLAYTENPDDDPTMLIKGPNGIVICADDELRGRYPQAHQSFPKGSYEIWVGSKNANRSFKYKLSLSETIQK